MEIESEIKFQVKLLLKILALPLTLLLFIVGKKEAVKKLSPIREITSFITSAKATLGLIIVNILSFVLEVIISHFNPKRITALVKYPSDILSARCYTVITAGFLHANVQHLLANMFFLFLVGRVVEKELGGKKTVLIYFLALIISGVVDSLISLYLGVERGAIGASGAIMGLVSTAMLLAPFYITFVLFIPLPMLLVGWIVLASNLINLPYYMTSQIGYIAHMGGFFSIALIGALLSHQEKEKLRKGLIINLLFFILGTTLFLSILKTAVIREEFLKVLQALNE